jgi:hypothetical protein
MKKLITAITAMILSYGAFAQIDTINRTNQGSMPNFRDTNRMSRTNGTFNQMYPDTIPNRIGMDQKYRDSMRNRMGMNRMNPDTMRNNNGDINGASQGTMPNNNAQNNGMKPDEMGDGTYTDKMKHDNMPKNGMKKGNMMRDSMHNGMNHESMNHKMANMSSKKMVMMQDGKVVIMRNGISKTVMNYTPLSNGTKVMSDGTVVKKDGTKTMLNEGEHINMAGEIMPK